MFSIGKYIENLGGLEGGGQQRVTTNGYGVYLWDNENVLELGPGDGGTIL